MRKNYEPTFAAIRLRLAKIHLEGASGYVWAYLRPSDDPEVRPEMTLRAEIQEMGKKDVRKILVLDDDESSTADHVPLSPVLTVFLAETVGELFTLVCYCYMVAAHAQHYRFDHHFIPIDQEFINDLTKLCSREGFRKEMKTVNNRVLSSLSPAEIRQIDGDGDSETSDSDAYLSMVEGSNTAPNYPFGRFGTNDSDSVDSENFDAETAAAPLFPTEMTERINRRALSEVRIARRTSNSGRGAVSRGRSLSRRAVLNAALDTPEDNNNSRLEAALKERRTILGKIDKAVHVLPRLWAREKQLVTEIERLRDSAVEDAYDSTPE